MNVHNKQTFELKGFQWEYLAREEISQSGRDLLENKFSSIQKHLQSLGPDDREWFVMAGEDHPDLFVKVFRFDSIWKRLRYTVLSSQARKEWNHLMALVDTEVPAPTPVAIGETYDPFISQSVLICEHVSEAVTLREYLEEHYGEPYWADLREPLWSRLGDVIAEMIAAGFHHQDFHDQNLLVTSPPPPLEQGDPLNIWVSDVHRAKITSSLNQHALMKMIAFLIYSLDTVVPLWECMRVYRTLQDHALLRSTLPERSTLLRYLVERRQEHRYSRTKSCLRDGDEIKVSSLDGSRWTVYHHHSITTDQAGEWVRVPETIDPESSRVIKNQSDGRVLLGKRNEKGKGESVVLKETTGRLIRRKLERAVSQSKPRLAWWNAHGLYIRGIRTPEPLALIEPNNSLSNDPSIFVQEYLEDAQKMNFFIRDVREETQEQFFQVKRKMVTAIARFVRMLHREGIYHKDLKANNILVQTVPNTPRDFYLIDLDRVEFFDRPLPAGPRIKNLSQLNASIPPPITAADRLHAWKTYINDPSIPFPDIDAALNRIMKKTRKRNHEWPC